VSQKIAVAIIHGAGSQGPDFADATIARISDRFQDHLQKDDKSIEDKLVFKSVYWADILAKKEQRLWNTVIDDDGNLNYTGFRKFIINFGADAVAYQPGADRREVYNRVHSTMASALTDLAAEAGPQAPLCIIGHSIGTVITHNYLFDLGEEMIAGTQIEDSTTLLEAGKTLVLLYMMGSPLALWSLRYDNYRAITFPGLEVPHLYPNLKPRWVSYYDKDDILAYPNRSLSQEHNALWEQGLLEDIQVNVGGILSSWNPLSHLEYWTSGLIIETIADDLFNAWQTINLGV